ncbi:MAG: hypothetical protein ABWK00_05790 [Desulfurococcaceae archaeon]
MLGRRDVLVDLLDRVFHGGTFTANVVAMAQDSADRALATHRAWLL